MQTLPPTAPECLARWALCTMPGRLVLRSADSGPSPGFRLQLQIIAALSCLDPLLRSLSWSSVSSSAKQGSRPNLPGGARVSVHTASTQRVRLLPGYDGRALREGRGESSLPVSSGGTFSEPFWHASNLGTSGFYNRTKFSWPPASHLGLQDSLLDGAPRPTIFLSLTRSLQPHWPCACPGHRELVPNSWPLRSPLSGAHFPLR